LKVFGSSIQFSTNDPKKSNSKVRKIILVGCPMVSSYTFYFPSFYLFFGLFGEKYQVIPHTSPKHGRQNIRWLLNIFFPNVEDRAFIIVV
jgi:hypothetical protein